MNRPLISADSHVTEPLAAWADVDPAFRDRVPRLHHVEGAGDVYVIDGMKTPVPLGIVAAAGKPPELIRMMGTRFEDLHRGGWDPAARLLDQDLDGVAAEVIYPTIGMVLCNRRSRRARRGRPRGARGWCRRVKSGPATGARRWN